MTDRSTARRLDALGDPTRRHVLELLRGAERSVAELTSAVPVSQSAVSQHLRVLKDAGLVVDRAVGRRRLYRVDLDGLTTVRAYLDSFWDDVLTAFARYADAVPEPDAGPETAAGSDTDDNADAVPAPPPGPEPRPSHQPNPKPTPRKPR